MITPYELWPASKPEQMKSIRVPASGRKQVVFQLVDADGKAEDLSSEATEPGVASPDYSPQPELSETTASVRLRAVDRLGDSNAVFDLEGEIVDHSKGYISFLLDQNVTGCPGLYHAEVGVFAGDYLSKTFPVRIIIEPSVFAKGRPGGTLTVPEVRLALLDQEVDESSLLDEVEFRDEQILQAARRVIDLWNETPPMVLRMSYSRFPWREWWLKGTLSYLYGMAAARYRRDALGTQAGGISTNENDKAAIYEQMAQLYRQEFIEWMRQVKVAHNMNSCWATGV